MTGAEILTLPGKLVETKVIANKLFLILRLATGVTLDLFVSYTHSKNSSAYLISSILVIQAPRRPATTFPP
jgi:hypothetical protein